MSGSFAYIGSWNVRGVSRAFSVCGYNPESGKLTLIKEGVGGAICVGSVYIDRARALLYCTDERPGFPEERVGGGRIYVFRIDSKNGELHSIDRSPSWGAQPSYVIMDDTGKYLLVTNYGSRDAYAVRTHRDEDGRHVMDVTYSDSSLVLLPLKPDGSIGEPCDIFTLPGSGPKSYQATAHAHCVQRSPSGKLFAVCDKGADRVYMFRIDYERNKLILCDGSPFDGTPGSAPRYCAFHPSLPYLFINKEGESTVTSFRYDEDGHLEHICTINSLPEESDPHVDIIMQSDFQIDRQGKYIYDLHRVVNMVSVLEVDEGTGALHLVQSVKLDADNLRGCDLSPDGHFLLVTGVGSGKVFSIPIGADGRLERPASIMEGLSTPGTVDIVSFGL
jgi:6-phosphogluconolactonase (cycloisomerase 2 family)